METKERNLPCSHFDPTDSISGKGRFAFELGEDGSFTICRAELAVANLKTRSETSSMEANVSTVPDINSIAIDDVGNWMISATISPKLPLEPFKPAEKSQLVDGVGDWSAAEALESTVFPWRLEAVNLDDLELELEPHGFDSAYDKTQGGSNSVKSHIPSPIPRWNPTYISPSIPESSESMPPLTEDYSRDTDSIAISESQPGRDEPSSLQTYYISAQRETKDPLSPQLDNIGAGLFTDGAGSFTDFFTPSEDLAAAVLPSLERDNRTITPDRPHTLFGGSHSGDALTESEKAMRGDSDSIFSEGDSSDSESIWMSDYSEGVPVLGEGHPFLLVKPTVVQQALLVFQVWQQRPHGSPNNPASGDTSAAAVGGQPDTGAGKKRNRENSDDSGEAGDGRSGPNAPKKRSRTSKNSSGNLVSFACPFAKKDPVKYRSCYAYVLKRIRDVKQHLSRFHQLPIYCPRCMSTFVAEDERDRHIRASSCPVRDAVSYEGVTRAQKSQLTQRASPKMALEDHWFTIFEILFPGHKPRPRSAYVNVELTVELEGFQDLMYAEGPNIILAAIRSSGIHLATMTNEEHDLSALLQSAIDEGLHIIAQRWSASAVPDGSALRGIPVEGSTSSHTSRAIDSSQPSRASSDTLVEHLHEAHSAEQSQQVDNGEQDQDGEDQPSGRLTQLPLAPQGMVVDAPQPREPSAIPSDTPSVDQEYYENLYDADMDDEGDFWTEVNQCGF